MSQSASGEIVTWINVVPLNRREKIARWWVENVRGQQTYSSPRQREQAFQTSIPVIDVDSLASEGLRAALYRQRQEDETGTSLSSIPRATPDGSQYFGSVLVRRKLPSATSIECGIESMPNED